MVKSKETLRAKPSQRLALDCLKLDHLAIICPESTNCPLDEKVKPSRIEKLAKLFRTIWSLKNVVKNSRELFHVEHSNGGQGIFWDFELKKRPLKWR